MAVLQEIKIPVDLGGLLGGVAGPINLPPPDAPGKDPGDEPKKPPPPPPRSKNLQFAIQKQEHSNWCWAAVAVSVADFYDKTSRRQCDLVNQRRGLKTCCSEPDGSDTKRCDQPDHLEQALSDLNHFSEQVGVLTFREVQNEIVLGRVMGIRIAWPPPPPQDHVGHAITLDGYYVTDSGERYVIGKDPAPGDSFAMLYDEFKSHYGDNRDGTWHLTYRTK